MNAGVGSQLGESIESSGAGRGFEAVIPNPKFKFLDQVSEQRRNEGIWGTKRLENGLG
jgi:hypothetical protein